jgi:hypothetical protein
MKLKLSIPENWNDCTDAQLVKIALLMSSGVKGLVFDYKLFRILVAEKWWHLYTKAKVFFLLSYAPMREIKPSFDFIYQANTLTRFPSIKPLNGNQYYSPLPQISNLTIGEMAVADDLHIKFRNTGDTSILPYLAATLYVMQQQPRPPYDKNDLSFKAPDFEKLSLGELLVIEMAFAGCKEYIAKKFPTVFPAKANDVNKANQAPPKKANSSQFPKLILELSGGKFGTHEQTSRTNCYVFLAEFENLLKQPKK